ncbi:cytochrome-c peroxidase [Sulfurimonas sp.]|uniref:cytochrome-c peroxidase n=1 Tax=Sulfurimonas sp. TaxID=2022749 RepID=UPI003D118DD2
MKTILWILLTTSLFAMDDFELMTLAYKHNLKPVPNDLESLRVELKMTQEELSKEKIILGKKLFFEKELSLGKDISCATCHSFNKGGADARQTAIGHLGQKNPFHLNTPTVLNSVFSKYYFWNGRSTTLADQAKGPLQASFEMAITPELAQIRIANKKEYVNLFQSAYGSSDITFEKIADALSSYEKTLLTRGRYDDYLLGYANALAQSEKEGLELFITKGCVGCHNGRGLGGEVMRKFPLVYHKAWSMDTPKNVQKLFADGYLDKNEKGRCTDCHSDNSRKVKDELLTKIAFPFENKGEFLGANDKKYFRVPLLRNVVRTKPYFHNGSVEKLEDAIKIMGIHQLRINLDDKEIQKIISFLKAVDGEVVNFIK